MKVKYLGGGWVANRNLNINNKFQLIPGKVYDAEVDNPMFILVGDCGNTIYINAVTDGVPSFEIIDDKKRIKELENVLRETQDFLRGLYFYGKVDYETWCNTYEPLRKISSVLNAKY